MLDEIDQKPKKRKASFVERVAEKMGVHATAKAVYAEPVEHDGVTVIPVAKVRWGFGGGSGRRQGKRGKGAAVVCRRRPWATSKSRMAKPSSSRSATRRA